MVTYAAPAQYAPRFPSTVSDSSTPLARRVWNAVAMVFRNLANRIHDFIWPHPNTVFLKRLDKDLSSWVNAAGHGTQEAKERLEAKIEIMECARTRTTSLTIDSNVSSLPDCIGSLTFLKELIIINLHSQSSPSFSTLPDTIGQLSSLEKLDCRFTSIKSLPDSIFKLTSLKYLACPQNLAQLSEAIGDLSSLKTLVCSTPSLPNSIRKLTKLKQFGYHNQQVTELPPQIKDFKNLTFLDLSHTSNLKELPKFVGELKGLLKLNIYESGLRKQKPIIPPWLFQELPKLSFTSTNV